MALRLARLAIFLGAAIARGAYPNFDVNGDSDLERYVSRPDLRPPKFDVTTTSPNDLASGYWFLAPYTDLISRIPTRLYQPTQVGPHIYDGRGNLIWSGGALFPGRNHFDFKLARTVDDQPGLSFILGNDEHGPEATGGLGVVLDSSFNIRSTVNVKAGSNTINMHEFTTIHNGKRALLSAHQNRLYRDEALDWSCWIVDLGFFEVDVETGNVLFEWWASDHINPLQSTVDVPKQLPGFYNNAWDWFHINSIDKNDEGDYLISARHMNTIYKISGGDGSILWRLGGAWSNFTLDGFNFSSQHDARFRKENSTHTVISFLNNASDGKKRSSDHSSAMLVALNHASSPPRATLLSRWLRPDQGLSNLRGNVQILPNSNTFVCWSANGYISEHSADGRSLMAAHFSSTRLSTYRAYKFDFTSSPKEDPVAKAFVYGATPETSTTVFYASWNGATEIASWRFWASKDPSAQLSTFRPLGTQPKDGFESMFMGQGPSSFVFAEAIDARGNSLRNSSIVSPDFAPESGLHRSCENTACGVLPFDVEDKLEEFLPDSRGIEVGFRRHAVLSGYLTGLVLAAFTVGVVHSRVGQRVALSLKGVMYREERKSIV